MPETRVAGARVTCDDCYFRQELLCALDTDRVCPTFRATVGRQQRRPVAPRQAQLVPVTVFAEHAPESTFSLRDAVTDERPVPAREAVEAPPKELPTPAQTAPRYAHAATPSFAAPAARLVPVEPESRAAASAHDAGTPAPEVVPAPAPELVLGAAPSSMPAPMPRESYRAAAAALRSGTLASVTVDLPGGDEHEQVALPLDMKPRRDSDRMGRVARRIAARYPNAVAGEVPGLGR